MDTAKIPEESSNWQSVDIFLFSNGQQYSPPRKYHLRSEDLEAWDATRKYLGRMQYGSLVYHRSIAGVCIGTKSGSDDEKPGKWRKTLKFCRHSAIDLYTIDGEKITGPLEIANGVTYVAVEPPDEFINAEYEKYLIKATRSWERRHSRRNSLVPDSKTDDIQNGEEKNIPAISNKDENKHNFSNTLESQDPTVVVGINSEKNTNAVSVLSKTDKRKQFAAVLQKNNTNLTILAEVKKSDDKKRDSLSKRSLRASPRSSLDKKTTQNINELKYKKSTIDEHKSPLNRSEKMLGNYISSSIKNRTPLKRSNPTTPKTLHDKKSTQNLSESIKGVKYISKQSPKLTSDDNPANVDVINNVLVKIDDTQTMPIILAEKRTRQNQRTAAKNEKTTPKKYETLEDRLKDIATNNVSSIPKVDTENRDTQSTKLGEGIQRLTLDTDNKKIISNLFVNPENEIKSKASELSKKLKKDISDETFIEPVYVEMKQIIDHVLDEINSLMGAVKKNNTFTFEGKDKIVVPDSSQPLESNLKHTEKHVNYIASVNRVHTLNLKLSIEVKNDDSKSVDYNNTINTQSLKETYKEDKDSQVNTGIDVSQTTLCENDQCISAKNISIQSLFFNDRLQQYGDVPLIFIVQCACCDRIDVNNVLGGKKAINTGNKSYLILLTDDQADNKCDCKAHEVNNNETANTDANDDRLSVVQPLVKETALPSVSFPVSDIKVVNIKQEPVLNLNSNATQYTPESQNNEEVTDKRITFYRDKNAGCTCNIPPVKILSEKFKDEIIQTDWTNVMLEARPDEEGRFMFYLPPLDVLKDYTL